MQLAEIRIDEATWAAASPERRREWRVVLDELIAEHRLAADISGSVDLRITVSTDGFQCEALSLVQEGGDAGRTVARCELALADLDGHLREYLAICQEMGTLVESATSPRVEALDIAKRLVHDEAASTLRAMCRSFDPDHATARRLFTLLVTLHFDTTKLVRPHHLDATLERRRMRELLRGK